MDCCQEKPLKKKRENGLDMPVVYKETNHVEIQGVIFVKLSLITGFFQRILCGK